LIAGFLRSCMKDEFLKPYPSVKGSLKYTG
jgi:hypothetical protein